MEDLRIERGAMRNLKYSNRQGMTALDGISTADKHCNTIARPDSVGRREPTRGKALQPIACARDAWVGDVLLSGGGFCPAPVAGESYPSPAVVSSKPQLTSL